MSVLVVTGTDTEVGKTVIAAALACLLRDRGMRVAVVKPVQTGLAHGEPGDLDEIHRLSGVEDLHEFARLPDPLAPATAARRAGVELEPVEVLAERIGRLAADRNVVLVEGAGGLLVALDSAGATLADLAALLHAPAVVVAAAGLGTLNASALTCEALAARGVDCLGLIVGAWPAVPDLAARCNLEDLPRYTGAPLLGRLAAGAGRLQPAAFRALAAAELGNVVDALISDAARAR